MFIIDLVFCPGNQNVDIPVISVLEPDGWRPRLLSERIYPSINLFLPKADQTMNLYKRDLLLSNPRINGGRLDLQVLRYLLNGEVQIGIHLCISFRMIEIVFLRAKGSRAKRINVHKYILRKSYEGPYE